MYLEYFLYLKLFSIRLNSDYKCLHLLEMITFPIMTLEWQSQPLRYVSFPLYDRGETRSALSFS